MLTTERRTFSLRKHTNYLVNKFITSTFADVMVWIPNRVTPLNRESGANPGQSPLL